jgi:predicted dehydrogenase
MSEEVRVGVVGTSRYADFMHLPALKSHPQANLSAICGRNRARAEEMAKKYGITQVFSDYQEMIDRSELDALVVAAPEDLHYPITMAALKGGLHVLCEKPLASTAQQAKQMYDAAIRSGRKHMVFFTYRWSPVFQYVHRLIGEGFLGSCFYAGLRYNGGHGREAKYAWRWDARRGLGALGDMGAHVIDLARWLIGDIVSVHAQLSTFVQRPGVEGQPLDPANDAALLSVVFRDGAMGALHASAVAHLGDRGQEMQIILHGEKGTLEAGFNWKDGYALWGATAAEKEIHPLPIPDDILGGVVDPKRLFIEQPVGTRLFIDSIVNDQTVSPSFYDGLQAQEVIEAALRSYKTGAKVSIGKGGSS